MSTNGIVFPHFASPRRITRVAVIIGLISVLVSACGSFLFLHAQREASYVKLANNFDNYLTHFFNDLQHVAWASYPLLQGTCAEVGQELTSRAAFMINVRTILLVKDGNIYCSSATGQYNTPLKKIAPELNLNHNIDTVIMPGTPRMPNTPTIGMWFRSPYNSNEGLFITINISLSAYILFSAQQDNVKSIALVVGDKALSTGSHSIVDTAQLPTSPNQMVEMARYPMKIYIYAGAWHWIDLQISILASLIIGLMTGSLSAYILMIRARPGKEILTGIKRNEFYIVYQPVVRAQTLELEGVELLMRWQHPISGNIPPDIFIQLAEAQNLIIPLTQHLFDLLMTDIPRLHQCLPKGTKIAINLAPSHLYSPSFKNDIQKLLSALPQQDLRLICEITERDMLQETKANDIFNWLHQQGIEIAVDDFGTGHSALIYLEKFKLDHLKIDHGFINAIGIDTVTAPVLDSVIALAQRLKMTTVAEGVETAEQARWLIDRGVTYLQGYYFCRPLPLTQFEEWCQDPPNFREGLMPQATLDRHSPPHPVS